MLPAKSTLSMQLLDPLKILVDLMFVKVVGFGAKECIIYELERVVIKSQANHQPWYLGHFTQCLDLGLHCHQFLRLHR